MARPGLRQARATKRVPERALSGEWEEGRERGPGLAEMGAGESPTRTAAVLSVGTATQSPFSRRVGAWGYQLLVWPV